MSFLKGLKNDQLEAALLGLLVLVVVLSFIEVLAKPFILVAILIAPVAIGFGSGILFHYMDKNVQYKTHFSGSMHARLGTLVSFIVGSVLKHLATQIPLIPYSYFTNAILLIIAPKAIFFILGILLTGFGYYLSWKGTADERGEA